jgi:hypothetical protein
MAEGFTTMMVEAEAYDPATTSARAQTAYRLLVSQEINCLGCIENLLKTSDEHTPYIVRLPDMLWK